MSQKVRYFVVKPQLRSGRRITFMMISKEAVITNELGLHARSAAQIAKLAARARHGVWLAKGEERAAASSIIDLIALECPRGTKIAVIIDNPSDREVLDAISELIENGFGE